MCNFFSFLSDGKGNYYYSDWDLRKQKIKDAYYDSHSWLARHFLKNGAEDKLNCYEFNPFTKKFTKDKINIEDDSESAEKWANEINWKRIVKPLIIKPIVNPLKDIKLHKVTKKDISNLKKWIKINHYDISFCSTLTASISVEKSVVKLVQDSVWASVQDSVWASSQDSDFFNLVWNRLEKLVLKSVGVAGWHSVRVSVQDSVWAYMSTFFDIKYKFVYSSGIELWNRGFVPSFDGKTWRLHQGSTANIVYELKD